MKRETVAGERNIERGRGTRFERDRKMGREKERDRDMKDRERESESERERGEKEKKLQTQKNLLNFILSCFTPPNGVKHDSGL